MSHRLPKLLVTIFSYYSLETTHWWNWLFVPSIMKAICSFLSITIFQSHCIFPVQIHQRFLNCLK